MPEQKINDTSKYDNLMHDALNLDDNEKELYIIKDHEIDMNEDNGYYNQDIDMNISMKDEVDVKQLENNMKSYRDARLSTIIPPLQNVRRDNIQIYDDPLA